MVSSDTIVGIVGAVILTGAMIAVFYYENNTVDEGAVIGEGDNTYNIVWTEEAHPATEEGNKASASETVDVEESYDQVVSIPNYTTEIDLRLEWTDEAVAQGVNEENEFRIVLLDQDGNELASQDGAASPLTITHTVQPGEPVHGEPEQKELTARGDTAADAEAAVKAAAGSTDYTVRVTLSSSTSPVPDPLGTRDTSNGFTFYLGYTHWHAYEESRLPMAA